MVTRKLASKLVALLTILLVLSHSAVAAAATYTVKDGDSLWRISKKFDTSVREIMEQNGLVSTTIYPGQVLNVPAVQNDVGKNATEVMAGKKLSVSQSDLELLARLISAEASQQPYKGMVAVGAVVINRVKSPKFPNTIKGVIFQPGQFEPVWNGWFWRTKVTEVHRQAARDALGGVDPTHGALYFFVYKRVSNRWLWSRPWKTTIGDHRFTA